jgi:hypothetical protein
MRVIGSLVKLIQPSATIAAAITRGGKGCRIDHAEMLMATNVLPLHPSSGDHCHHMTCVSGKPNLAALSPPQMATEGTSMTVSAFIQTPFRI